MKGWIGRILTVGRVTEVAGDPPLPALDAPAGVTGSLQVRHVDAGSCNGCAYVYQEDVIGTSRQ